MDDFAEDLKMLAVGVARVQGGAAIEKNTKAALLEFVKDVAKGCAEIEESDRECASWWCKAEEFLDEIQEKAEELIRVVEEVDRG